MERDGPRDKRGTPSMEEKLKDQKSLGKKKQLQSRPEHAKREKRGLVVGGRDGG